MAFVADEVLKHGDGAIDRILTGEAEVTAPLTISAWRDGGLLEAPGAITLEGKGPPPTLIESLDDNPPARDLTRKRHKYFIGHMDPSAYIKFTRSCPGDCTFC